jgi:hypothetical protein
MNELSTPEPSDSAWTFTLPGSEPLTPEEQQYRDFFANVQLSNALQLPRIARESGIPVLADLPSPLEREIMEFSLNAPPPSLDFDLQNRFTPRFTSMTSIPQEQQNLIAAGAQALPRGYSDRFDTGFDFNFEPVMSALEYVGRTVDVPAGVVRDGVDIVLQRLRAVQNRDLTGWTDESIGAGETLGEALFSHAGEDFTEFATRAWDRISTLGHGEDVRFESYIDVLNRYICGIDTEAMLEEGQTIQDLFNQGPLERGGMLALGIAADIYLDPLWLVGRIGSLGTRGEQLLKINDAFDEVGLLAPESRTMSRLAQAQLETGKELIAPGSPLWKFGEMMEQGTVTYRTIPTITGPVEVPTGSGALDLGSLAQQWGSGSRGLLARLQLRRYDTVPVETMWSRATRRLTGDRFVLTTEFVPMGGRALAPALEKLERFGVTDVWTFLDMITPYWRNNKFVFSSDLTRQLANEGYDVSTRYGIESGHGLYQIRQAAGRFSVTGARVEAGNIQNLIRRSREFGGEALFGAMHDAAIWGEGIEKALDDIVEARITYLEETSGQVFKGRMRNKVKKDIRNSLERQLNDYAEAVSVRGDELENFLRERNANMPFDAQDIAIALQQERSGFGQLQLPGTTTPGAEAYKAGRYQEGAAYPVRYDDVPTGTHTNDMFYNVTEDGIRMEPISIPDTKRVVRQWSDDELAAFDLAAREFDPLDLPMASEFDNPAVRDMVREMRQWQHGYVDEAVAAGLRMAELRGTDPIAFIKKWATKEVDGETFFDQEVFDEIAGAYLWHRVSPETWEWMRNQKQPWVRKAAHTATGWSTTKRFYDTWSQTLSKRKDRRMLTAFNDFMREKYGVENFFETNPAHREPARWLEGQRRITAVNYYSRMADHIAQYPNYILPAGVKPQKGWMRLSEMMSKRAWDAIAWDSAAAKKISSVVLPEAAYDMVMRQAELLQRPDYLKPYMRFLQQTTNWWKTNTLGIWPGYHTGNFISNLQLLWLGGMHDPLMFPLAAKIAAGHQGVVKSIATGVEWSYDDIRRLIKMSGVDVGFVRGNIEQAVTGIHSGRVPRQLMEGYDQGNGYASALAFATGIDARDLDHMNFARKLLPGGEEWIGNRIGFMVGGSIEGNARTAMFLHLILNEGWSPARASKRVKQVLFDYTKREGWKQVLSTLVPFYEFTAQNTIFQALNVTQNPGRHSVSFRLLQQTLPAITGDIEDQQLPEWLRGRAMLKLNSDLAIDITRFLPAYEAPAVLANLMGEGFSGLNPFIETGVGLAVNLNLFTRKPIKDYAGEKSVFTLWGQQIELPNTWHFTFRSLSRMFAESERGDWMRTLTGIKLQDLSEARTMQFDVWDINREISDRLGAIDPSSRKTEEHREQVRMELIELYMTRIALQTKQYDQGEDMDGNPRIPFSRAAGITDQYDLLTASGRDIESIMELIEGSTSLTDSTRREMAEYVWAAWAENTQARVNHLGMLAQTELDNGGAGRDAPEQQRERMIYYYERALDVIDDAAGTRGIGPYTYIALKNEFQQILDVMAGNMLVPRSQRSQRASWVRGRLESFAERHPELEELVRAMEDIEE